MQLPIAVGEPQLSGPLTLFPIKSNTPVAPVYLCGPEAEVLGVLEIREAGRLGRVPELAVENRAEPAVLLIEGETLVGAKQNRTLNVSVLCAPGTSTTIPVSCVEAGRWGTPKAGRVSSRHAPNRLRGRKSASVVSAMGHGRGRVSNQAQVWSDVDGYAMRVGASSATHALEDVYVSAEQEARALLSDTHPVEGQRGVIAAIGGEIVSLDLFDKSSSLASYWDGLVAGYALEAMRQPDVAASLDDAKAFAAAVASAAMQSDPAAGLGQELRFVAPNIIGLGLEWEGGVVHLAAFTNTSASETRPIRRRRPT
jgi:hypothetical protein